MTDYSKIRKALEDRLRTAEEQRERAQNHYAITEGVVSALTSALDDLTRIEQAEKGEKDV